MTSTTTVRSGALRTTLLAGLALLGGIATSQAAPISGTYTTGGNTTGAGGTSAGASSQSTSTVTSGGDSTSADAWCMQGGPPNTDPYLACIGWITGLYEPDVEQFTHQALAEIGSDPESALHDLDIVETQADTIISQIATLELPARGDNARMGKRLLDIYHQVIADARALATAISSGQHSAISAAADALNYSTSTAEVVIADYKSLRFHGTYIDSTHETDS